MERLTVPDKKIEGGISRALIDTRVVRKEAMTIYWALKKYEDTGLTPEQIREIDKLYTEKCRELAEYKQAEEQGTLMRLPCKIGNTVYAIEVDEENLESFHCPAKIAEHNFELYMLDLIGKCMFLNRQEAEAKLAEMEVK